jgi:hypothetical protein
MWERINATHAQKQIRHPGGTRWYRTKVSIRFGITWPLKRRGKSCVRYAVVERSKTMSRHRARDRRMAFARSVRMFIGDFPAK